MDSFVVRNNGFAISTPSAEQYAGDGIASRGPGYGISTIRVDGNDVLAVRAAMQHAKAHCTATSSPFLVECMTYRVGHHSTSDDSSAYRNRRDVEDWKRLDNPLARFSAYCAQRGWWSEEQSEALRKEYRADIVRQLEATEKKRHPSISSLFQDTYKEIPAHLQVCIAQSHHECGARARQRALNLTSTLLWLLPFSHALLRTNVQSWRASSRCMATMSHGRKSCPNTRTRERT